MYKMTSIRLILHHCNHCNHCNTTDNIEITIESSMSLETMNVQIIMSKT
jgi:hypothetical protein